MDFKLDIDNLSFGMETLNTKFNQAIMMFGVTKAQELEDYMKENRKWTDRTNLARQSLTGKCEKVDEGIKITLSHGVDYGIWLELAHEKKYAIVQPTILLKGNETMEHFKMLINKMGLFK